MAVTIIDNFLEKEQFLTIKTNLLGNNFPWFYNNSVVHSVDVPLLGSHEDELNQYQFTHMFYIEGSPKSDGLFLLNPILEKINPAAVVRIKANLNPRTSRRQVHGYHSDYPDSKNMKTAIYYVNSNDGITLFQDGTEVESVENRFVEFDTELLHSGTSCTNTSIRCVINFNYFKWT